MRFGADELEIRKIVLPFIVLLLPGILKAEGGGVKYVGSSLCSSCHENESTKWRGSHHELAMQHASALTVLGDFKDKKFTYAGNTSRFYKKGEEFWVTTDGPDGTLTDYKISFTFGVYPLQQYLIEFPGGKLQALNIAWDSRSKRDGGDRWFHLFPNESVTHSDPLHWTHRTYTWNHMCADCHSTGLTKGYTPESDSYNTTYAEISVGCEACHGPGSKHVAWAANEHKDTQDNGLLVHLRDRGTGNWRIEPSTLQPTRGAARVSDSVVENCAPCHSRRTQLREGYKAGEPFLDYYEPALLSSELYHVDGQMREEVYEYGSFLQSKMFAAGVVCSDCHDAHSLKLKADGDELCAGCHAAERFESKAHHFHAPKSVSCVSCHMPATNYMVIDARHDHSFRIPRPDISQALGTPNACNKCHKEKDAAWAAKSLEKWYGNERKGYQKFAQALAGARAGRATSEDELLSVLTSGTTPAIAQATVLYELARFLSPLSLNSVKSSLENPDALVRFGALRALRGAPAEMRAALAAPRLSDRRFAVRNEAVSLMAEISAERELPEHLREPFGRASTETVASLMYSADTPQGQASLGLFYSMLDNLEAAVNSYRTAIKIEPRFIPAYLNLADLYRSQDRDGDAEKMLRSALSLEPNQPECTHSLGLLLVRQGRRDEALSMLKRAAELAPGNANLAYVYGVALHDLGELEKASEVLEKALKSHPDDRQVLFALVSYAVEAGKKGPAKKWATRLATRWPNDPISKQAAAIVLP